MGAECMDWRRQWQGCYRSQLEPAIPLCRRRAQPSAPAALTMVVVVVAMKCVMKTMARLMWRWVMMWFALAL